MIASVNWADHLLYQHYAGKFDHLDSLFDNAEMRVQVRDAHANEATFERMFIRYESACTQSHKVQVPAAANAGS